MTSGLGDFNTRYGLALDFPGYPGYHDLAVTILQQIGNSAASSWPICGC